MKSEYLESVAFEQLLSVRGLSENITGVEA